MKKILMLALLVATAAIADVLQPGKSGAYTDGGIIKGVVLASTNATQTANVKAVYSWPQWGSVSRQSVETRRRVEWYDAVDVLTNWCDYATSTAYTNIVGGVTNVVYYDGITTVTNRLLRPVQEVVTNTVSERVITGYVSVTNTLYTLTATNGMATSTDRKPVGAEAELLIENAPVTIFWE